MPHHPRPISRNSVVLRFSTGRECRNVRASRREMSRMQWGRIVGARTGAAAILAGLLASAVAIDRAAAADENSWPRFPGSAYGSQSEPTDREFIKEWEATPPKGYPTLSPANLAAMKVAIKRYTDIVAAGGWRALPDDIQL